MSPNRTPQKPNRQTVDHAPKGLVSDGLFGFSEALFGVHH
jgi:hypothetical protein